MDTTTLSSDEVVNVVLQLQVVWNGINGRCNKANQSGYTEYGARGITLCKEWSHRQGCIRFIKWALKNGWRPGLVTDRIDGNKGYAPSNVRFVTQQVNMWNSRKNVMLTYKGETKCIAAWGSDARCVVHSTQFQQRIKCGWPINRALFTPIRSWGPVGKLITYKGVTKRLGAWGRDPRCAVSPGAFVARINKYGWKFEPALLTPPWENNHAARS